MNAVETHALTKRYQGHTALDGVALVVPEGSVFGFLGRNGAGKTTTLRILLGMARPSSGSAMVFGHDVTKAGNRVRQQIGFLPDVPGYYPWMTAPQFLTFTGQLFGLDEATIAERRESLLAMAGLDGVQHRVGGFSRGMKQRLGIAQALMNAPRLLVLDEPTSALDPAGRHEVLTMVEALRDHTTVLVSTHILADVERVCDQVAILDAGRVVVQSSLAEVKARHGGGTRLRVRTVGDEQARARVDDELTARPWCAGLTHLDDEVELAVADLDAAWRDIPALCAAHGLGLARLEPVAATLEDIFLELVA